KTSGAVKRESSGAGAEPRQSRSDASWGPRRPTRARSFHHSAGGRGYRWLRGAAPAARARFVPRPLADSTKRPPHRGERFVLSAVPVGFEPTDGVNHHMFSRHAPSAARTRYRREV